MYKRQNTNLQIGDTFFESIGNADVFLAKMNADASLNWALSGGSISIDESAGIALTESHVYWTGTYWLEANFGNLNLTAKKSSKSIFLLQYTSEGTIAWSASIHGTGTKNINDIKSDAQGNIYLTGSFSDSLFYADTVLIAKGATDLFLLKLNDSQELLFLTQAGDLGEIVPEKLEIASDGSILLAGSFQGEASFGDIQIETNTSDDDVFIARFSANGESIWGRKAGGVHEQFCSALTLDESDNIYVGGNIVGVMTLSDDIVIQSPNLVDNLFLLKYDLAGTPIWGRSMGALDPEFVSDLQYKENQLILSGYFRESLEIDNFTATAEANRNTGFLTSFDLAGQSQWLKVIGGDNQVFLNEIALNNSGDLFAAGTFNESVEFDNETFSTNGLYDICIARNEDLFTSSIAIDPSILNLKIYPNPAHDYISIETDLENFQADVIDIHGQILLQRYNEKNINISRLPVGTYFLKFQHLSKSYASSIRFIKL